MSTPTDVTVGTGPPGSSCLSREFLEEYAAESVARHAPAEPAEDVQRHLAACAECRRRLDAAKTEAAFMHGVLDLGLEKLQERCPTQEDLARYLDDAVDAESRVETERHLARCGQCRLRLVLLFEEVQTICKYPANPDITAPVSLEQAREKLVSAKATSDQLTGTESPAASESVSDQGENTEERKQRYSSQSS